MKSRSSATNSGYPAKAIEKRCRAATRAESGGRESATRAAYSSTRQSSNLQALGCRQESSQWIGCSANVLLSLCAPGVLVSPNRAFLPKPVIGRKIEEGNLATEAENSDFISRRPDLFPVVTKQ